VNFRRIKPCSDYLSLRFESETGRWNLGLSPYQHGVRIRMGLAGRPPSLIDFCLGHDGSIYSPMLLAVMNRLEQLPESSSAEEIDSLFPWARTRPDPSIHLEQLLSLAAESSIPTPREKKVWTGKDSNLQPID